METTKTSPKTDNPQWMMIVRKYAVPVQTISWSQLLNSLIPYILLWITMVYSLKVSYWLTLALSVFAAGFMVRLFIIFHDCGHGSFFKSRKLNLMIGILTGFITYTPYHKWHRDHKVHHATMGNLDKRGTGDVKTLTVKEYQNASGWNKFLYRLYRNPFFLFGIAPIFLFVVIHRFTKKQMPLNEKIYNHLTSLSLGVFIWLMSELIGWKSFLMIQVPVLYIASAAGLWLFYVQHQFDGVLWTNGGNWDYKTIALKGSSYYKLPFILQWFTGNIGFHHIHHLSPLIPNYNLEKCHDENPDFQVARQISLRSSLHTLRLRLWNEEKQRMVAFSEL